jgi:hypothetical protein
MQLDKLVSKVICPSNNLHTSAPHISILLLRIHHFATAHPLQIALPSGKVALSKKVQYPIQFSTLVAHRATLVLSSGEIGPGTPGSWLRSWVPPPRGGETGKNILQCQRPVALRGHQLAPAAVRGREVDGQGGGVSHSNPNLTKQEERYR